MTRLTRLAHGMSHHWSVTGQLGAGQLRDDATAGQLAGHSRLMWLIQIEAIADDDGQ